MGSLAGLLPASKLIEVNIVGNRPTHGDSLSLIEAPVDS